jgi:hypothetical protein
LFFVRLISAFLLALALGGCAQTAQQLRENTAPVLSGEAQGLRQDVIKCVGRQMQTMQSIGLTDFNVTTDLLGVRVTSGEGTFVVVDFDDGSALVEVTVFMVQSEVLRKRLIPHTKNSLMACGASIWKEWSSS